MERKVFSKQHTRNRGVDLLKFKALYNSYDFIHEENLLEKLLKERGVNEPKKMLNMNESNVHDGMLLKNIDRGLDLLYKHIRYKSNIHIIIDDDVDGLTSAAMMYLYIKDIAPRAKITYGVHKKKSHGIILDELKQIKFDLLIVPDAGTNDIKESRILNKQKKDILCLDHHDITIIHNRSTVINCKDGQYPNPTLSGAGVVYKFCKQYDVKYNKKYADKYLDLLALGCVADSMDMRELETRYLTLKGIQQFGKYGKQKDFLQEIIEKQSYGMQNKITIRSIGWSVAPLLNAAIRVGEYTNKIQVFQALIGEKKEVEYQPRRKSKNDPKPPIEIHSLQKTMARICGNLKSKQDRLIKDSVEVITKNIADKDKESKKVLFIDCSDILESSFTGLVANKLQSQYKRPVVLTRERKDDPDYYGGSCRNYNLSPIPNFKNFLSELKSFDELAGHGNAFGFKLKKSKLKEVEEKIEFLLKNTKIEDTYIVDYEIPVGRLKNQYIEQVAQWQDMWGNQLEEPLFAVTDIYIGTEKIKLIGSKQNIIKFEVNGVTFIKKYANEEIYNKIIQKQSKGLKRRVNRVKINVIGKFVINEWENMKFTQVEIVDFDSVEDNEILF